MLTKKARDPTFLVIAIMIVLISGPPMILTRVPQRTESDCVIAVVATVMGASYTYETVSRDQLRYPNVSAEGLYFSWWETYLRDEGFPNEYHMLADLNPAVRAGTVVGIVMLAPIGGDNIGHVIAVDELGCINPATNWPERISTLDELLAEYERLGCSYTPDDRFLAIWPRTRSARSLEHFRPAPVTEVYPA
jgi:hypothetical protein